MREVFPRDPDLLVAAGTVHEIYATPLGQQLAGGSGVISQHKVVSSTRQLVVATAFYSRALGIDGEHAEAMLRWGRLRFVAGASADAETAFRRVIEQKADRRSTYLGHLFLGFLYEQQEKTAAAADQYERAIAIYPDTQAAPLALATLRARTGGGSAALAQLAGRFDGTGGPIRSDPWSDYLFARSNRVRELAEVARESGCR
jgi:tetratricopeptide (TPR) repeat protein